ncbi:Helix-turn-helix [uncultured archaeon]|nr:Helix-turn-helix [uncultured archaeon]
MKNSIPEKRKKLGLTQEALAGKCGVSRQTIIAIEQGRFNPSLPLAFLLTRALRARKVEEVFDG